ncbi:MAG: DUF962 domain-containing protein [Gemmataceae bacterium]|nr:DUF962 domain-containing protein [Gemmataceae bacterium]
MTQITDAPQRKRFPIARAAIRFAKKALRNWRDRHQLSFNFYIHLIGIPMALAGLVLLFMEPWYWGLSLFVMGYVLQYIGHQAEGNDVGEWAGIKRLLGLPTVGISPRWQQSRSDSTHPPA